ncbi:MAG: hypothetical protein P1V20_11505 [Verrucomicrobiales bacterium]|nr:hypothetical protein [Verrucomicrobiales bacterium]
MDKVQSSRGNQVYLVRGKDRGEAAWHYVLVDKVKEPVFRQAVKNGTVDCSKFGEIIESGWGEEPPAGIRERIEKKYG